MENVEIEENTSKVSAPLSESLALSVASLPAPIKKALLSSSLLTTLRSVEERLNAFRPLLFLQKLVGVPPLAVASLFAGIFGFLLRRGLQHRPQLTATLLTTLYPAYASLASIQTKRGTEKWLSYCVVF